MDIFKRRLPRRDEVLYTFGAGAFFVHLWTFYNIFNEVPAWVIRMNLWEVISVVSYVLVFALIDSLMLIGGLILLAALLPSNWFKDHFIAQGSISAFLIASFAAFFHLWGDVLNIWSFKRLLFWGGIVALTVTLVSFIVNQFPRISSAIQQVVERLAIVSAIYFIFDIISVIIVLTRNLYGWLV